MKLIERLPKILPEKNHLTLEAIPADYKLYCLALLSLRQPEKNSAEEATVRRIMAATKDGEIQLVPKWKRHELVKPVAIRKAALQCFGNQGWVVCLVARDDWVKATSQNQDPKELEFLYGKLKQALGVLDRLKKRNKHVLSTTEICEMARVGQMLVGRV